MPSKRLKPIHKKDQIKGFGIYAITPFDNVDDKGKMVVKIGITQQDMSKRINSYHTYLPEGVWYLDLLKTPTKGKEQFINQLRDKPTSYFITKKVWKEFVTEDRFKQKVFFRGVVTEYDEKNKYFMVVYEDGDKEELTKNELVKIISLRNYLEKIESSILKEISKGNGNIRVESRVQVKNDGETEWVYTDEDSITRAFDKAQLLFGGVLEGYSMKDIPNFSKEKKDIYYEGSIFFDRKI